MNQEPLDELIAEAIDQIEAETGGRADEESVVQYVLASPKIHLLLDGYEMHDRSGSLEEIMHRDIRRKTDAMLRARGDQGS